MRPTSSADIATRKPPSSSPRRFSSGTRTPSSDSSAVSCARSPSLPLIGRDSKPSASVGTTKHVMPRGPSPPVRAKTSASDAHVPSVMNVFEPREHPAVAVTLGTRDERGRVRAATGLGQRVAAERLARRELRQPVALLLLGAEARDRLADEADVDGDDAAHRRVGLAELLDDERVRQRVELAPAVGLLPARAQIARRRRASRRARGRSPPRGPSRARAARSRAPRTPAPTSG